MSSNAGFRPQEIQRRKFQQAVAQTLDAQAQAIQVTREFVADLSTRLDALEQRVAATTGNHAEILTEIRNDRYARTFLGRLRWLVTGR